MLIVVSPFMKYLRVEDKLDFYLDYNGFAVETADFENSLRTMEEEQLELVFKEYSEKVKSQVVTILQGEGLRLTDFKLLFDREENSLNFGGIIQMEIKAENGNEAEKQVKRIFVEDIEITRSEQGSPVGRKPLQNAPSPAEISIKIKLSDFYNIKPDNINISIQGG